MRISKLSKRQFNQQIAKAMKAAKDGPVFITDSGRPSHVLLTVQEYNRLTTSQKSILEMLAMPEAADIEFEPPRWGDLHKV